MIIDSKSVKIIRSEANTSVYYLTFKYTFETEVNLSIFYCGYE